MELLIVFWVFCGIAAALIGEKKSEGFFSFWGGVVLGPISLYRALYGKKSPKQCPVCKNNVPHEAITCPTCHRTLPWRKSIYEKVGGTLGRVVTKAIRKALREAGNGMRLDNLSPYVNLR